ncbi:MAG: T9SS type A sorting domain-containing protein [Candidatus Kapabacteria bacterium]|nr:T9SS type A sorting domain-containing protein [Ignavibacteriota bacterium]MCW5883928.1 T9SS type A sorting domain-containing protein [Candidatus Kapabacteria bacterium]
MKNLLLISIILFAFTSKLFSIDWRQISSGVTEDIYRMRFNDTKNGWILSDNFILKTDDAGETWEKILTLSSFDLSTLSIVQNGKAWFAGKNGKILHFFNNDNENEFVEQKSGTDKYLLKSFFLNENLGWIVGFDGIIIKTTNGGAEWLTIREGEPGKHLFGIQFIDEMNGWAVGEQGTTLKTTDGGSTWQRIITPAIYRNLNVNFSDRENGWISGFGFIVKTTNGGSSWNIQISTTVFIITDFMVIDKNRAWASFDKNSLLYTDDGGENWQYYQIPNDIERLTFDVIGDDIIIAGSDGKIYKGKSTVSVNSKVYNDTKYIVKYSNDEIIINFNDDMNSISNIEMFDLLGNQIFKFDYPFSNIIRINPFNYNLAKGIYFLKIGNNLKKIILQ